MSVRDADTQHADASVARYVDVVVNTHIGDEATYAKFIQKNQHTDVASREKIQAIAYVENRVEKIGALFRTCQRDGHERVYNMCVMLSREALCTFEFVTRWQTCELSGICTNSCIRIRWAEDVMIVDQMYHCFVVCLWLVTHIHSIETSRIDEYLQTNTSPTQSIKETIEAYHASKYATPMCDIHNYVDAFVFVETTLKATCGVANQDWRRMPGGSAGGAIK